MILEQFHTVEGHDGAAEDAGEGGRPGLAGRLVGHPGARSLESRNVMKSYCIAKIIMGY